MLVPLIAVFGLQLSSSYTQLVLIAYCVQLLFWFVYYMRVGVVLSAGWALFGVATAVTHVFTLIASGEVFGTVNVMDVADAGARVVGLVLLAGLAQRLALSVEDLRKFLRFVVGVGFLAVVGAMVVAPPWEVILSSSSSYAVNFRAFFGSRNQLGGFLFVAITGLFLIRSSFAKPFWFSITFGVLFIGLLLTMSRSAIGATLVMLVVLTALRAPFPKFVAAVGGGGLSLLLLVQSNPVVWAHVERLFIRADSGLTGRDELWGHGLRIFHQSPLFGVGGFQAVDVAQTAGMVNNQFHSFFIESLAGAGVAGFMVRSALLLIVLSRVLAAWRRGEKYADVFVAAFGGLFFMMSFESVSFLSIGYVDTLFGLFFIFVPFAVFSRGMRSEQLVDIGQAGSGWRGRVDEAD